MSAKEDDTCDDVTFDDPWERLANAASCLEMICEHEDIDKLRRYRMLVQSLEQQIQEEDDGR